ncbi:peptide ABC transporter permease [Haladaptatus sp. R4]|uniref:ABC transporter permease n=1 Tax=Haladaptatus sp. R4 TaxID=1679489 RepID=UPI0007B4A6B6|nr:ABC transporter permease [Haladaptatus sp. R4]KZN25185.1 peptide ABC transporter permease [Haladaptatus sp. R4]
MSTNSAIREEKSLRERIADNPRPAALWLAGFLVLLALEFGALWGMIMAVPWGTFVDKLAFLKPIAAPFATFGDALSDLPTLLSRSIFDNTGWQSPSGGWKGTFLGLSPAVVWAIRVVLVYAYTLAFLYWLWRGYLTFREHYRYADWTPRDDMVNRFRNHTWGLFGFVVVFMFVVMAIFAPALGPTTLERNIQDPYSHQIKYLDKDSNQVKEALIGDANSDSQSEGSSGNVGPMTYDDYGRYHPFGTLPTGKDLFTFMMHGARVSLFIGLTSIIVSGLIATAFALLTAYYKGAVDLLVVVVGDSVMSIPRLLLLILLSYVLKSTWLGKIYNGGLLFALLFAATGWPFLWRAVRGPAMQVSEQEWIDAAKSFGQSPVTTMKKHMAPYILGYLLVYSSMTLGGIIISVAALSFLGLGINAPTPEWGRAISVGQTYTTTASWHISLIPGVLIVLIVTAFNALGDGIRDAVDPQSETGDDGGAEVAATGGSGA